ncbi:MAG: FtsX-like permease family protein [Phycisphaerae bacterium]|nr:FtsX-like permease family protein [Phycisphaerae bacterium]NIP50681.1 FtsX-like permease family protein [Phycisphaerae bacterium]NIS52366.1 FtsX-like permease family protein [Phycisphaerae bacterium]NIU11927.1 FtsX-like permease family protein [Phycisphaerae bacterium]NIU57572.1 FtsX-like permease family protein [Phycisphaerae bacterium]
MEAMIRVFAAFFRLFYQSVYLALGQIWTNKTRSILTTIGIVIGVASVTAVIAALTGLQAKVEAQVETFGTNTIFILPTRPDKGSMRHASWWTIRFLPENFDDMLEHCPSVARFSRIGGVGRYTAHYREKSVENVEVTGIEPAFHEIQNRSVEIGRKLSVIDNIQVRPVCLIDPKLRDELRLDRDCIGQTIRIGHHAFSIVGVIEGQPELQFGEGGQEHYEVFVPFKTTFKMGKPWIAAFAASKGTEVTEEAQAEISFFLRRTRNIKPGEPDTFRVESVKRFMDTFKSIALMVTLVAGGIVGISLLVGGVGIMNIMLVSVSERTREIGLRKAVGAKKTAILTQFLIEAVVLCLIGGLAGVGIGQCLTMIISGINPVLDMVYIPAWAILLSFSFAGSVGIFFGMFPAIKAARLDPIEALRHE